MMNGNVRTDMLRQGGMPQPPPSMLGLNTPPFMQNPSQSVQQQPGPNHMGLPPNVNNANPPMGMLGGSPNNAMSAPAQRHYMQQMQQQQQQGNHQQRQMLMRQTQGGQPGIPNSHMATHSQLQGMGFPGNMMQQPGTNNGVRRVASQPTLNPSAAHFGGIPQGVNNNMNMGMNPQNSMPGQLRQVQSASAQQQHQLRIQQQQMAEMAAMTRQTGNPGMPPNVARPGSTQNQLMNSLSQPPSIGQASHSNPMQSSHHQNNFQNPNPLSGQHPPPQLSSSPRPGSHPQTHTPNMPMPAPGPSHTPVNRTRMTPDDSSMSFMGFQNTQFSPGHNANRMSVGNGQFPFAPSSTPPIQMSDISQPMSDGLSHTPSDTPNRAEFHLTPAQQYAQMQPGDPYAHFNMPPPNVPPRPPSHNNNNHHPPIPSQQNAQQPQHHQSPHQSDPMMSHPQRPQSQPQRPPSQGGPSHTPHASQSQLPTNPGLLQTGRIPPSHHGAPPPPGLQPQASGSGQHMPIAPRPPLPLASAPSSVISSQQMPVESTPASALNIPRPTNIVTLALGSGQGLIRLLQFSGVLAGETKNKLQLSWWNDLVKEYFTPKAVMKFTLWKDNQRNEAKPFEIGVPILPRFFLVTTQSGVKSMTLTLDGARERMYAQGHSVVECVTAVWTYKYHNGYTVTLRGPLTVHVVITSPHPPGSTQAAQSSQPQYVLKFEDFQFDANLHDKFIALESVMGSRVMESPNARARNPPTPTSNGTTSSQQQQREEDKKWEEPRVVIERASIPGEPVNAFGIPQATMRCLELAESVGQMADLISFSNETQLGPLAALTKFAAKIRDTQPLNAGLLSNMNGNGPPHPFASFPNTNGVTATPAVTLYSSAPPSVTNPSSNPQPPSSINSPQNPSSSASNSPQKHHKSIPQPPPGSAPASAPVPSPSMSSGTTNTPSLPNATLKRKQASDTASPTTVAAEQPLPKRSARKRGRTTGGG